MCAPCKVIINEENGNSARLADIIAHQLLSPGSIEEDDALYGLAVVEVEHVLGVRDCTVKMAQQLGAPERWVNLLRKLAGQSRGVTPHGEED